MFSHKMHNAVHMQTDLLHLEGLYFDRLTSWWYQKSWLIFIRCYLAKQLLCFENRDKLLAFVLLILLLSRHTHMLHLLESRKTPLFPQMFHMSPICWSILHYDNPANCHLSVPYTKQSKISPELLIHLRCIMAHIWDCLFVAFEASLRADGTWNHVRSHEFMMCFISPAPPCCRAQTAADVMECTFVNIYPGEEPMNAREVHNQWRHWQNGR